MSAARRNVLRNRSEPSFFARMPPSSALPARLPCLLGIVRCGRGVVAGLLVRRAVVVLPFERHLASHEPEVGSGLCGSMAPVGDVTGGVGLCSLSSGGFIRRISALRVPRHCRVRASPRHYRGFYTRAGIRPGAIPPASRSRRFATSALWSRGLSRARPGEDSWASIGGSTTPDL